jgi:hypothetical protein
LVGKKGGNMRLSLILVLFLSISFSISANQAVGKIISLEGRAFIKKGNSNFKKLKMTDSVENGDILKTSYKSRIKISFIDNSVIYIAPKSQLKIDKYEYNNDKKERNSVLNLFSGRVKLLVAKLSSKNRDFKVKTETATVGVRGTEFIVSTEMTNESEILVLSGSVEVINPLDSTKQSVLLNKNDIIKTIGNLPVLSPSKATKEDIKRLTSELNIPTMIKLKLNYSKLLRNIKLKKLLKKNNINLKKLKRNKKHMKKKLRLLRKRIRNPFKRGYFAPRRIKAKIKADVRGE